VEDFPFVCYTDAEQGHGVGMILGRVWCPVKTKERLSAQLWLGVEIGFSRPVVLQAQLTETAASGLRHL
jgi:hypothetical protein